MSDNNASRISSRTGRIAHIALQKCSDLINDMSRFVGSMSLKDYSLFNEAPLAAQRAILLLESEIDENSPQENLSLPVGVNSSQTVLTTGLEKDTEHQDFNNQPRQAGCYWVQTEWLDCPEIGEWIEIDDKNWGWNLMGHSWPIRDVNVRVLSHRLVPPAADGT